ncbi:phosphoribosylformylglycinamidine synthase subunit PurL [Thermomicrobium sp. 4228-Ro]|uniref:phosphoribosylformylglycinamidine synthase subunit PurL n=1 Tax=Thermomicrobium sp. 4228-Ro TaxID=2993937 RepID=UPI0022489176|nr:phosphoribosylformylglycinamidine synthase subunit PurL [Thermomicrobium sp. 4228-Ro]MCX2726157.1 phosphoribosylformylglycinamidine synthase subunit PurL [Thermomicrobium sp. 4228-Ro]
MPVTPEILREVALTEEEYQRAVELLGREPNLVELGMIGALWSEHCGYKHSRPLLKKLPTTGPHVVQGPGENAGAVDLGDGLVAVLKIESHNHPSAVEPFQGAATGVGGIVRDIFAMGARPIAIADSLRFGPLDEPRQQYLFHGVVGGIGWYGNCLGIPTVAGDVFVMPEYRQNPLVNAMCVGIAEREALVRARASGVGNLVVLVGADTGRDGIHGATFASVEDPERSHRGVVQVGNPFLEKLLLEACLEVLSTGAVIAMQDLGAAGLTSASAEIAARGGTGIELDVAAVPRRESGMTPYEVMLSESQERMLLVVQPDGLDRVLEIFRRWELHAVVIGRVTDDGLLRVLENGEPVAELPVSLLTEACPTYVREARESPEIAARRGYDPHTLPDLSPSDVLPALLTLLRSPNIVSRRPIYRTYDHTILTNTVLPPGVADAAVLRIKGHRFGIAIKTDCNPRYCLLDPRLGAQHAVAEASRNVSCVGAEPLAITDCLNFGNPERPEVYYQLVEAIEGIAEACRILGVPVVSGNVSLYNETEGRSIPPTPVIGVVGRLPDVHRHVGLGFAGTGTVFLVGPETASLGASEYLAWCHGVVAGAPPALDLELERRVQAFVREAIQRGLALAAHDCSEGGLLVALVESCVVGGVGGSFTVDALVAHNGRLDATLFGESGSRVVLQVAPGAEGAYLALAHQYGVPVTELGHTGGMQFSIVGIVECELDELRVVWSAGISS